jgi:hypothetical protein
MNTKVKHTLLYQYSSEPFVGFAETPKVHISVDCDGLWLQLLDTVLRHRFWFCFALLSTQSCHVDPVDPLQCTFFARGRKEYIIKKNLISVTKLIVHMLTYPSRCVSDMFTLDIFLNLGMSPAA